MENIFSKQKIKTQLKKILTEMYAKKKPKIVKKKQKFVKIIHQY